MLYLTVNERIGSDENGVSRKLVSKIQALQKYCKECFLLNAIISREHNEVRILNTNKYYTEIEIGVQKVNSGYFNKVKCDKLFYKSLAAYIQEQKILFDRIIFRYPLATTGLLYFTKNFKNKIVFEHNTKEIEELKGYISSKAYAEFNIRPSKFFFWYTEKMMPLLHEKWVAPKIFKNAHSGACVTTEIAVYEKRRAPYYKTFVSSNFYNVSDTRLSNPIDLKAGSELVFGIIITSTAPWYGLKRLVQSFSVKRNTPYKLIIAGIEKDNAYLNGLLKDYGVEGNIILLGKIGYTELALFYNSIHVCFGSLGLYNINLHYASTLKVKEAISYGKPVVIGYNEEDFYSNEEFAPYYYQVSNDDTLIDFDKLRIFAEGFYSDPENPAKLRNLAMRYMDVDVKMQALLKKIKT